MNRRSPAPVEIAVDAGESLGILPRIWSYVGCDECNYLYVPEGRELLAKLGALGGPVHVRTHHLFCTGSCHGAPKWGSTNVYREAEDGAPIYDWRIVDLIFDAILDNGCRPFVELGFMPRDLADPACYRKADEDWALGLYRRAGWACPPRDYRRWHELVTRTVRHCLERYGAAEVERWYWELWNEPDISYWRGTFEEFETLYDFTADAVKAACPRARVGGPSVTNPEAGGKSAEYLGRFLAHVSAGRNRCTGGVGSPLDFVTFHAKGGGYAADPSSRREPPPSVKKLLAAVTCGREIISRFPAFRRLECVLSECDPDGWAAGGAWDNVNLEFRNTEYYASYVACALDKILGLGAAERWDVKALSWAFLFVGERCFEGTRTFSTQGIDKPVLNLFRMYSMLGDRRVAMKSSGARDTPGYQDQWGNGADPDVGGVASRAGSGDLTVFLYSHHDNWDRTDVTDVAVSISRLPFIAGCRVAHYRIDGSHSNAHAEWVRQGRPMYPNAEQYRAIKLRDGLELLEPPRRIAIERGAATLRFSMPARSLSLLVLSPGMTTQATVREKR
jgi:xylan 1,4-beta-xylosidase